MKVRDVIAALEEVAPLRYQESYDNAGLQVGEPEAACHRVLVCLDVTEEVVDEAIAYGCSMVVSHHPLIFRPLKHVTSTSWQERCVIKALRNGISIYSAHTNLDNAAGGVNHMMASVLGLENINYLEEGEAAGDDAPGSGSGLIGELPEPCRAAELLLRLKDLFGVEMLMYGGANLDAPIRTLALCGGAGSFLAPAAHAAGADCFVTGEISYHNFFESSGMLLVAIGHYQSERYTIDLLQSFLQSRFPSLEVMKTSIDTNPVCYL